MRNYRTSEEKFNIIMESINTNVMLIASLDKIGK